VSFKVDRTSFEVDSKSGVIPWDKDLDVKGIRCRVVKGVDPSPTGNLAELIVTLEVK